MSRKKLIWQVYPYYFIVLVAALLLAVFYSSQLMKGQLNKEVVTRLESVAKLAQNNLTEFELVANNTELNDYCRYIASQSNTRITLIAADGIVLGDSERDPNKMENHGARPEIAAAFLGQTATRTRFSNTIQQEMLYVATPVYKDNEIIAVVRAALPTRTFKAAISSYNERMIAGGVIITIFATLLSFVIFRRLSRPLADLKAGAERFARGEFATRLAVPDTEEIGGLAESMNKMAEELNERISTIVQQRNEQEALLSSMIEGVIAVDANERIFNINRAAAKLLNIAPESANKSSIYETVRHAELHDFVKETFKGNGPIEKEILIQDEPEKIVQAHGSVLTDSEGVGFGAVIVLNDVTHLKRLENIRKEFVANVSHELKTPITSIRGFVETLLDGAMSNADDTKRFLEIINKQTDRLNSIVNDLLALSRIEKESERGEIELVPLKVWDVLTAATLVCEQAAKSKGIRIVLSGEKSVAAGINRRQLEQAIINLIDNAIKYSDTNSLVEVSASKLDGEVVITVKDQGCGIDKKHLHRLFERFYRVDKARSREVGGTGLGLAIVKHIALAHGGNVTVESEPGKGSSFFIYLPVLSN